MKHIGKYLYLLENETLDKLNFKTIKEFSNWMNTNIEYAWADEDYKKYTSIEDDKLFYNKYRLMMPEDVVKHKFGVCWDQCILEGYIFDKCFPDVNFKIIFASFNHGGNHTVLIFEQDKKWFIFENAFRKFHGIHGPHNSIESLISFLKKIMAEQTEHNDGFKYSFMNYKDFNTRMTCDEFMRKNHFFDE